MDEVNFDLPTGGDEEGEELGKKGGGAREGIASVEGSITAALKEQAGNRNGRWAWHNALS